ncbi:hypothetical protein B0O80DRAFT_503004 [Mortierella sp. GBAus27b]|nr:hypothetical protein BGX31_005501 [Mortierella sp. GBA43]KAI8347034.1 hypothetical protein B0O80DRAFT_503004 [Mortierella sp. GBAus27b]
MPLFTRSPSPRPAAAQQQQQRPTTCTYKTCVIEHSDTQHLMRRHTEVPYYFRHKDERVKFIRTGKEGDDERPYLCTCQQIFHEQHRFAEHLYGTCRVYGTPATVVMATGERSPRIGCTEDQVPFVPQETSTRVSHPPPYSQVEGTGETPAPAPVSTMAPVDLTSPPLSPSFSQSQHQHFESLSQPQTPPAVASPYCPSSFQELLFTKLDHIGDQVAALNQRLIPREAYPHVSRSTSPRLEGERATTPPPLSPALSSPGLLGESPRTDNHQGYGHDGYKGEYHSGEFHVHTDVHSRNHSTRPSRSNSQSSRHSNINSSNGNNNNNSNNNNGISHTHSHSHSSSHSGIYDDMSMVNDSIHRLESRFGNLETCCAHILDKLDKVEQRHQEISRDTRVVGQFTDLITGFAKSVRDDSSGTMAANAAISAGSSSGKPEKSKYKLGWRSQSARNLTSSSSGTKQ